VADAFIRAADSEVSGRALNVGSGHTYSVNRLVELLHHPVVHIPKRPGEPDCTFADIQKIKTQLHWQPRVSLEQGVKRMMDQLEEWKHAPVWEPDSIARATRQWFRHLAGTTGGRTEHDTNFN
jgi:UDP-glucose 4-epimerase